MRIRHNYLSEQFKDYKKIFKKISEVIKFNDFTLGINVEKLENKFCKLLNVNYALGVGSGTDAIFLSLKALGIKEGDEVITPAYSFYATAGAIATTGARPVFVDIKKDLNIDETLIEKKINKKTKAIVPVHWAGRLCNMEKLLAISKKYKIPIIEDACHAILAKDDKNNFAGTFGLTGCFSFHPLKNLNVWGDGGIITTNNKRIYQKLKLLRNHGLSDRNNAKIYGFNSRLDTIQATVALELLKKLPLITRKRIFNSTYLNSRLKNIKEIEIIYDKKNYKTVFHLFQFFAKNRNKLQKYLRDAGVDCKIHYPIPLHLQTAAKKFNYKKGDFVNAEFLASKVISIPVHEFLLKKDLNEICSLIKQFYEKN